LKKILGISAFYHDSAAALVVGGEIVAAAQEERFTREKHTAAFPVNAIRYCLEEGGLSIDELDAVVFYDKPFLKFERLLETYYAFSPKGLLSFLKALPVWLKEKLFLKKLIRDALKATQNYDPKKLNLLFSEHHLSHAASAFYSSPFEKAAILTIDGVGEWCTASIGVGEGNNIRLLKEMEFPHSVGLLYSAFTYYLGFKVNSGEYKLMGLAPYGDKDAVETQTFIQKIKSALVDVKDDGSVWLNQSFFNYATGLTMTNDRKWSVLFGLERRQPDDAVLQAHCNLALAIQTVTEEVVLKMALEAKKITGAENLCMAGGVALNCVANARVRDAGLFSDIFVQPASGDAGGALGAALAVANLYFKEERKTFADGMKGAFLGPYYSEKEIEFTNKKVKASYKAFEDFNVLTSHTAKLIVEGNVVGWFQGRMEFGPRALGNRSILADARDAGMQQKLNLMIKQREGFRPFAPSVLEEDAALFFDPGTASPYMLFTSTLKKELRKQGPLRPEKLPLTDRLKTERCEFAAVTHLDYSARVQTVNKTANPRFWQLLQALKNQTGVGMVINTSFNVRGEPPVCTPYDAYRCFMSTGMDYLVIGNFLYCKTDQPDWQNSEKWKRKFEPD
jgi:carbamoyltransferase